jgi:Uma2 family endonuclease
MSTALRIATYADLEALPPHLTGELIEAALYAHPRPAVPHAEAGMGLANDLRQSFGRKKRPSGPGGWIILYEPELHLGLLRGQPHPKDTVVVPDLAGWKRDRVPRLPKAAAVSIRPDWVCEILSTGRRAHDRVLKLHVYATAGIPWYWLVDPAERTVEVLRLNAETALYTTVFTHAGGGDIQAPPFDAVAFDTEEWWMDEGDPEGEDSL